jgi:acyl-CoA reductase-like NAD-dependent aldehyde dehydrogenase
MHCFINGHFHAQPLLPQWAVLDKTTGDTIDHVPLADAPLVDTAVQGAHTAWQQWRTTTLDTRVALVRRCAQAMRTHAQELGHLITRELGRPSAAARGEITRSAELLDIYAEEALELQGQWAWGQAAGSHLLVVREPVGVVAAITPFNYPITLLCFKLGAALLAGCTVVAKPSEDTPLSTLKLAELLHATGLPAGVFQAMPSPVARALRVEAMPSRWRVRQRRPAFLPRDSSPTPRLT